MSAITAGEAFVKISVDDESLKEGLRNVSDEIAKAARNIQAAESKLSPSFKIEGVENAKRDINSILDVLQESRKKLQDVKEKIVDFSRSIVNSFGNMLSSFAKAGDDLDKMAGRTGVSAQALSEYGYAAQMCGASLSSVESAVKAMQTYLTDAADNGGEAAEVFKRIGVSIEDLKNKSPEEQFDALAKAIARVDDPSRRAALAMKVFGDSGQALLPFFNQGPEKLEELREEARKLGVSMTESSALTAANYTDAMARINAATTGLKTTLATMFAPAVTNATNSLAGIVAKINDFTKEHPTLTSAIIGSTVALGGMLAAIKALNVVVPQCIKVFEGLKLAIKALDVMTTTNKFLLLAGAIAAASAALIAFKNFNKNKSSFWSDEKQQALEAGNAIREQDAERMRRLEELAAKENLTTMEIAEASRLAEELNQRYGDVGISVDAVTRKINIATNAQSELNKKMIEARKKELEAGVKEKEINAKDNNIAKKLAKEEVGDVELAIGRKRGQSWKDYLTSFESYDNDDDARLAILENDEVFQAKVKAEEAKNQSELAAMQAELDAINANESAPPIPDKETEEEKKKKEEARKKRDDASFDLSYTMGDQEHKAYLSNLKRQEAEKELLEAYENGDDETIAAATRKYLSAYKQHESDQDALKREQEAQEREKQRQEDEQRRAQEEADRQQKEQAEKQARAKEDRKAAEDAYFNQNASVEDRWDKSFKDLQAAEKELKQAQQGGDDATIAAALRKLTGAQKSFESVDEEIKDKYATDEGTADDVTESIEKKVESVGTFSSYQAQAWGGGMDGQRKLYEENKRQTEYLRRLVDLMGDSSAMFV